MATSSLLCLLPPPSTSAPGRPGSPGLLSKGQKIMALVLELPPAKVVGMPVGFDLSERLQGAGLKTISILTPEEPSPSTLSGPGGQRQHGGWPACRELREREGMLGVWTRAMRIRWPRRRRKALAELARLGNAILVPGVPIPRSCRGLSLDGGMRNRSVGR